MDDPRSNGPTIVSVRHRDLRTATLAGLRTLFDREYRALHGEWDPELPYGYARHDVHVLATEGDDVLGHVGWGRRTIAVGGRPVVVAGVGGVLVAPERRGAGLGALLMDTAVSTMRHEREIEFGYLGCDASVVPFYVSNGWRRIRVREVWVNRDGEEVVSPPGPPLLILPLGSPAEEWPPGDVDLRGRAW